MNWELGEPLTYSTERGAMVPLSCSTIWPEVLDDGSARSFAARLEFKSGKAIGGVLCAHGHGLWVQAIPCQCGAVV